MLLYVIGPVTGHADLNRPAFEAARALLERRGYSVEIPHDTIPPDADWKTAMAMSAERLVLADGVAKLNGWRSSRGARIEAGLAREMEIPCKFVGRWR